MTTCTAASWAGTAMSVPTMTSRPPACFTFPEHATPTTRQIVAPSAAQFQTARISALSCPFTTLLLIVTKISDAHGSTTLFGRGALGGRASSYHLIPSADTSQGRSGLTRRFTHSRIIDKPEASPVAART
jgi:hypothetical protein